jgi:hypothetical protein
MKKFIFYLSLVCPFLAHAQTTPNLNLNIPIPGTETNNWKTLLNNNFSSLDSYLSGGAVEWMRWNAVFGLGLQDGCVLRLYPGSNDLCGGSGRRSNRVHRQQIFINQRGWWIFYRAGSLRPGVRVGRE